MFTSRNFLLAIVALGAAVTLGCVGNVTRNSMLRQEEGSASKKHQQDPLRNPRLANKKAPDKFRVKLETTKGDIVLEVVREWSPNGADRFYNLVSCGFFEDIAIFRAIDGFMFQFGIHGDPKVSAVWREAKIDDDESFEGVSNQEGFISFATAGPNTRTTQMFVNLGDNQRLDSMGFTPFGKVVEGMDIVKEIETKYGENSREVQGRFQSDGNEYIRGKFPDIDYIKSAELVDSDN